MTPEQFYAQYLPYAQSVSQRTGLDPRLVLAQSALETGYGKSAPNMNFFGIKSHGRKGGSTLSTQEFEGGRMVQQPASFRGYETPEQSFMDYADFITSNPRYKGVLEADGLEAQIAEMAKSGYATDPEYGSKLASIASQFDPNSPKVIAAETMGLLGKGPQTATTGTQGAAPMMQEEKPRGLLGSLGIQKMEEGAAGETGQRFYNRDSFKDTAAILAQGFGRMGIMGMEEIADSVAKQRTEVKAKNKTMQALMKMGTPQAQAAVEYINAGGDPVSALKMAFEKPDEATPSSAIGKLQSDLASGLINQEQYDVALANMAPKGMRIESDGRGGFTLVQGAGVDSNDGRMKPSDPSFMLQAIDGILNDPALETSTGLMSPLQNIPGTPQYRFGTRARQLQGQAFLQAFESLKGGGQITENEGKKAEAAIGRLDTAQDPSDYRDALIELRGIIEDAQKRATSTQPAAGNVIEYDASGKRIKK